MIDIGILCFSKLKATEIYTHVMEKDISSVASPLDRPGDRKNDS